MDLALNNLQRLICHKTQQTNQLFFILLTATEVCRCSIAVIVLGNGLGNASSNLGQGFFYKSNYSHLSYV